VNTVILVAFAKITDELDLEHLLAAIKAIVPINPKKKLSRNALNIEKLEDIFWGSANGPYRI